MINCLIFTKNRAAQLDLLTRSIQQFFYTELDIHILAKATEEKFETGYKRFIEENQDYAFHWEDQQNNFHNQVMGIVDNFRGHHTVCFLDDDVFIAPVDVNLFLKFIEPDVNALSLRMSPDITHCYAKNIDQAIPKFLHLDGTAEGRNILKWNWSLEDRGTDWGYPMSLGGNIYKHAYLKNLWESIPFTAPNWIEGNMALLAPREYKPYQLCFKNQKLYNVANNLVQDVCLNRYKDDPADEVATMNVRYLNGEQLDLNALIEDKHYNSANGEAEYKWY